MSRKVMLLLDWVKPGKNQKSISDTKMVRGEHIVAGRERLKLIVRECTRMDASQLVSPRAGLIVVDAVSDAHDKFMEIFSHLCSIILITLSEVSHRNVSILLSGACRF